MEKTLNEKYSEALELLKNADGKKIAERLLSQSSLILSQHSRIPSVLKSYTKQYYFIGKKMEQEETQKKNFSVTILFT